MDIFGSIAPDSPCRDPGLLCFDRSYLHSAKDLGIKKGDKVSYFPFRGSMSLLKYEAKDIQMIDNG